MFRFKLMRLYLLDSVHSVPIRVYRHLQILEISLARFI